MLVIILRPTIAGGIDYTPAPHAQEVPDHVAEHLIEIGNARRFETKVEEPAVKKTSSVSQPAPASRDTTAKKSPRRKAKTSTS